MDDLQINTPKGEGENNQIGAQPVVDNAASNPQIVAGPNSSVSETPVVGSINLASEGATPVMEPAGQTASMPEKLVEKAAEIVAKTEITASPVDDVLSQMETVNPKSLYENANDAPVADAATEEVPKKKGIGKFKLIGGIAIAVLVLGAGIIFGKGLIFKEQAADTTDITRFAAEENCSLNQYAPESASEDAAATTEGTTVKHEPCESIPKDNLVAGNEQCALIDTLYENTDKYLLASETVINLKDWFDTCHPQEATEELPAVTEETVAVTQEETGITMETQTVTPKVPRKTKTVTTQETQADTMEADAPTEEASAPTQEPLAPPQPAVIEELAEPLSPAANIPPVETPVVTEKEVPPTSEKPSAGQVPVPEVPEDSSSDLEEAFLLNFANAAEPEVTCNGPYEILSSEGTCDFDCGTFLDDLLKAESDPAFVANVGGVNMTQRSLEDLLLQHEECAEEPSVTETQETQVAAAGSAVTQETEMAMTPYSAEEPNIAATGDTPVSSEDLTTAMHPGAAEVEAVAATEQATDITKELYPTGPEVYVYLFGFIIAQAYIFRKKIYAYAVFKK